MFESLVLQTERYFQMIEYTRNEFDCESKRCGKWNRKTEAFNICLCVMNRI